MGKCCMYVVAEGPDGPAKIGRSVNPLSRLPSLQTGNPRPLTLIGVWIFDAAEAVRAEHIMHDELSAHEGARLNGEWFDYPPRMFTDQYMDNFLIANGFEGRRIA